MEFDPLSWRLIKDHYFRRTHNYRDGSFENYDLRDTEAKLIILHQEWATDMLEQGYDPDEWSYEQEQEQELQYLQETGATREDPIIIN